MACFERSGRESYVAHGWHRLTILSAFAANEACCTSRITVSDPWEASDRLAGIVDADEHSFGASQRVRAEKVRVEANRSNSARD